MRTRDLRRLNRLSIICAASLVACRSSVHTGHCDEPEVGVCEEDTGDASLMKFERGLCVGFGDTFAEGACPAANKMAGCSKPNKDGTKEAKVYYYGSRQFPFPENAKEDCASGAFTVDPDAERLAPERAIAPGRVKASCKRDKKCEELVDADESRKQDFKARCESDHGDYQESECPPAGLVGKCVSPLQDVVECSYQGDILSPAERSGFCEKMKGRFIVPH